MTSIDSISCNFKFRLSTFFGFPELFGGQSFEIEISVSLITFILGDAL